MLTGIKVKKRDGRIELLDISKIQKYTSTACKGLKNVNQSELELDAKIQFRDGISTEEIQQTLIKTAVDKIDIDRPDWSFVASRLFLYDLYHKVSRWTGYNHIREYFEKGEKEGRIVLGLKEKYDLDDLNDYIKPERDLQFTYLGIKTLYDRYLLKDKQNNPIELPQHMFMAIAMFLAQNEENCQEWAKKFYDILSKFEVMAATPTLSNARTPRHQLSSCFIKGTLVRGIDKEISIEEIKEGDYVLTHNKEFKKVTEIFKREYNGDLISLKINGLLRDISATIEHPILSIKQKDVSCKRKLSTCLFNQGNSKYCFKLEGQYKNDCEDVHKDLTKEIKWNEIKELEENDFVSISFSKYNHNKDGILISDFVNFKDLVFDEEFVFLKRSSCSFINDIGFVNTQIKKVKNKIKLNKEFFLLIGYYLAEGHISKDKDGLIFTFSSKEENYINEVKSIVKTIFGIDVSIKENSDNSTNIIVNSKIVASFIYELVGTGFNKKRLSSILKYAKSENQIEMLIGAFRGDGCAIEEGYQLTLANKELIEDLFEIALRCGLYPYMFKGFKNHLATYHPYYLKIGVRNDKEFVLKVNKNIQKINLSPKGNSKLRYFWLNDKYFMRIEKFEKKEINESVYNIEVENDHSYSVNFVDVHNCYVGSINDNIEGIFDDYKEMALLSKFGGGIGWDVSKIRSLGSFIDNHKNAAGGVIPWLRITNDIAIAVDQLGCVDRNSFVKVMKNNDVTKTIPITEVQVGDLIQSFNMEKGEIEFKEVEETHEVFVEHKNQIKIVYEDGGYIITSKWHPLAIYENDKYIYKRSDEVKIGDIGVDEDGEKVKIVEIDNNPMVDENYFDLTVEGNNNYFCSTDKKSNKFHLIHNTRKGAIAVYLEPWHMDIMDFLELKKNSGEERRRAHDLFPALWINDLFMKRVENDEFWTLFDPYEVSDLTDCYGKEFEKKYLEYEKQENLVKHKVKAKELWKKVLVEYYETGNPFLCFKDNANIRNQNDHKGIIRSSNLCVTGDTRLATQFGLVKAKELEKMNKKIIASYDLRTDGDRKNYGVNTAECIEMYKTKENAKVYKITTKDGYEIKSTDWHEYYVLREKAIIKIPLKDVKLTDKLLIQSAEGQFGKEGNYELGLASGKKTKLKVPEFVFQGKKECVKGYLQGLFTLDATVNKLKNNKISTFAIQFATISEELAKDVQILLANFGIRSKLTLNTKRDSFKYTTKNGENKEYKSKSLYRLNINGRNATKFINEIGFIGEKQVKALNILIQREKLGLSVESNKSEYFETKIEKIEYIGKEDVYDTTQLLNHSLIFNGLVTGNCTEIYQNTEPNHYKVKISYEDESVDYFEEEEIVEVDGGFKKPAKKLSSIDAINGKKIYIAEKEKFDGDTAVCNLASVNLSKVNSPEKFKEVIPTAIRMLDNVIDLNFYPQRKVKDTNKKNRAIGLGVMGEAQYLAENQIEWGSEEHFLKVDEVMENFSYWVIKTSAELSQEKGIYPQFEGSRWEKGILPVDSANSEAKKIVQRDLFAPNCCDWEGLREEVKKGMRNGYLMAIAPTSSISILSGTTQAIEPVYKRKWFEENLSGLIPVVVPNLSPETWQFYTPAYELDQRLLVKAAAIRQKWVDQGQSLNIFIDPQNASGKYLNEIYTLGWKLGVKSFYYLRSKSPEAEKDIMDRSVECMGCQ